MADGNKKSEKTIQELAREWADREARMPDGMENVRGLYSGAGGPYIGVENIGKADGRVTDSEANFYLNNYRFDYRDTGSIPFIGNGTKYYPPEKLEGFDGNVPMYSGYKHGDTDVYQILPRFATDIVIEALQHATSNAKESPEETQPVFLWWGKKTVKEQGATIEDYSLAIQEYMNSPVGAERYNYLTSYVDGLIDRFGKSLQTRKELREQHEEAEKSGNPLPYQKGLRYIEEEEELLERIKEARNKLGELSDKSSNTEVYYALMKSNKYSFDTPWSYSIPDLPENQQFKSRKERDREHSQ